MPALVCQGPHGQCRPGSLSTRGGGVKPSLRFEVFKRKVAVPQRVRMELAERYGCPAGGRVDLRCASCQRPGAMAWALPGIRPSPIGWITLVGLEFDHVIPEHLGGETSAANLTVLCRRCNRVKGARRIG